MTSAILSLLGLVLIDAPVSQSSLATAASSFSSSFSSSASISAVTATTLLGISDSNNKNNEKKVVDDQASAVMSQVKDAVISHVGNRSNTASIVVGLITPNGTQVVGYGNISKANSTTVNGNTIFDIASVTKTFTTLLLADMVKRGLVNLDDPAQKYLPTANVKVPSYNGTIGREGGGLAHNNNTNSKPVIITLEDLATHTSGLPDFPPGFVRNQSYTTQQIYNAISNTKLQSEPGTRVNYSDIGMALLGHILSLRSGVPYEQLVKNKMSDVLGMDSTGISLTSAEKSILAKGHIDGKEVNLEFLPELVQPAGALHSTANDLLKYLSANMGLIQTKLNDIMQETQLIRHAFPAPLDTKFYIGLGWIIYTNFAREVIFHNGTIYGYESFVGFNPSSKVGLVILCSCDEKNVPPQTFINIGDAYLLNHS